MIDVGTIASGLSSLKAAKDIAESLINLRDTAKFQGAIVELQGKILAAQTEQFSLMERLRETEAKMTQLEAWETEKGRYNLKDYGGNTFAYELKPEAANKEPSHRICPACFQNGRKSILQFGFHTNTGQDKYNCPSCKTVFEFGYRQQRQNSTRANTRFNPFDV